MQRLEVSGVVRPIYRSLGVKGLITFCVPDVYGRAEENCGKPNPWEPFWGRAFEWQPCEQKCRPV